MEYTGLAIWDWEKTLGCTQNKLEGAHNCIRIPEEELKERVANLLPFQPTQITYRSERRKGFKCALLM